MPERWRLAIFPYEASDRGRVRRKGRRPRALARDRQGYLRIKLSFGDFTKNYTVHALVALAFIGPRPPGHHVNHIDGDKTNNAASNLEYLSAEENQAHSVRSGLPVRGEKHPACKINADVVRWARSRHGAGEPIGALARTLDLSRRAVAHIVSRTTWKHVA